jgi:hypothetical protein
LLDLASSSLHSRAGKLLQPQRAPPLPLEHPHAHLLAPSGRSSLLSLALLQAAASSRGQLLPSEHRELAARQAQLLRYLIRSPCFDAFTTCAGAARGGPLLPLLAGRCSGLPPRRP